MGALGEGSSWDLRVGPAAPSPAAPASGNLGILKFGNLGTWKSKNLESKKSENLIKKNQKLVKNIYENPGDEYGNLSGIYENPSTVVVRYLGLFIWV